MSPYSVVFFSLLLILLYNDNNNNVHVALALSNTMSDACLRTQNYGAGLSYLCGPPDDVAPPGQAGKRVEFCITSSLHSLPAQYLLTIAPWAASQFEPFDINTGAVNGDCGVEAHNNEGWFGYPDIGIELVPPATGWYQIDTYGSSYDTVLWLTQCDDTTSSFTEVNCDDNLLNQSGWSSIVAMLTANVSYHLVADGYGTVPSSGSALVLNVNTITSCPLRKDSGFASCPHVDVCAMDSLRGQVIISASDIVTDWVPRPDFGDCASPTSAPAMPDYSFSIISGTAANYVLYSDVEAVFSIVSCTSGQVVACVVGQNLEAAFVLDEVYVVTVEPVNTPSRDVTVTYEFRPDTPYGVTSSPTSTSPTSASPTVPQPTTPTPTKKPSRRPTKKPTRMPIARPFFG